LALKWVKYLVIIGMFVAGVILYPSLPADIPSHWGFAGNPDSWMPKEYGMWLLPGLTLVLAVLFPVLCYLDPKRENYRLFVRTWEVMQLSIIVMLAYIFAVQLYATLYPEANVLVGRFIVFGVGLLFVVLGNFMGKIRQNFFVGLRTPWSLSDPQVWQKSQRFAGWAFVLGGFLMLAEAFLWRAVPWLFFGIVAFVVVLPTVYSYLIFRRKKTFLILFILCLLILAALVVGARLVGSEDDWVCRGGQWVPHGMPSSPWPTVPCP
jgi:uncharacterized membrane protein